MALKDVRLNRRCQVLASVLEQQPTVPINQACEDWADTKAAYRFMDNPKVSPAALVAPHCQRTVERMKAHSLVLAVQDTTFFNYTAHPQTEGLGEIGKKEQQQRGFGMHTTLALTPHGLPLALSGLGQLFASESSALNSGHFWWQFTPRVTRRTLSISHGSLPHEPLVIQVLYGG